MSAHLSEWLNLIIRWMHLIAGISWIGSSFFFMWMDSHLEEPKERNDRKKDVEGELWMVHSGGFYLVEKYLIKPGWVPETLHWFKWEATFTWITGFFLLGVVYYMSGGLYLIKPESGISSGVATLIGLGTLTFAWLIYDLSWKYLFANQAKMGAAISFALTMGVAWGLSQVFSGRGMFIHIGAMFGTLMVANVWMRILPAQQKMIDATKRGEVPDYTPGKRAKQRSVHNNYMTFPVLFIMLSNHFPSTYGNQYNWLILAGIIVCGAGIRHFMNVKTPFSRFALVASVAGLFGLFFYTAPPSAPAAQAGTPPAKTVAFEQVQTILQTRCVTCHSAHPTDEVFKTAPLGAMFDSPAQIKGYADKIKARAVDAETMPLGNKTGMTKEERLVLRQWIDQGAKVP
ncbi:hypothetical protein COW36_07665 [bacterium (Candidatus Blackallbacteria) CG17_big_fil_post_rev_8_21_14_2_50_48_46]|uniref:Urate oxidase N-terminal domain-containing protein n=1 Tax=bacterium (Candidatus Blackallbacteria) CG17_big_fil_post_rev_8_21_14_2_50_48_46 TaxID=2014261 RepID=A0A2M7G6P6_9BACT|nr:MAG: hypothetical protein COW64_06370 [bacterium (Candidatus Blackallbacteria) CG18_big_fil_WC_8_21_14_2_50_49_26]PIW17717.1 MAG: hypothetical protein COW36_07665 [bacterium (Candidatus Blackallbacteria) CG17_big_fil_post_rev_8_21_14_2_50_48_46]